MLLHPPNLLQAAVLLVAAKGEEGGNRRRVYAIVAEFPGLHQNDIARRLGISGNAADHHLRQLVRAGLISRQEEASFVRFYVRVQGTVAPEGAVGEADKPKLALLRKARPLEIVAQLLVNGPSTMGDVAKALGVTPGNVTHHAANLEAAGILTRTQQGRERILDLANRDDTIRLLLAYEPPADLVAGFDDLWQEVGF
ncbi:MAG: winged helix-turn-helix transcriptional regulator [Candidatus Thermoplasmatota archaeon]